MKTISNVFPSLFIIIFLLTVSPYRLIFNKILANELSQQTSRDNEAKMHYSKGADFLDQKKYDNCIRESEIAIKLDPKLDGAYCNLGGAYFIKGMYDKALFYLEQAFQINPNREATRKNLTAVYTKLGDVYLKEGKYAEALKIYLELVELNPKDSNLRAMLGNVHHFMGSTEKALEEYQTAVKLNSDNPILYGLIGSTYVELKLYDKAIEAFKTGINLNSNIALLHYELGVTYYDKGLIPEAIEEMKQAIKIDPNYEEAKKGLKKLEDIKDSPLSIKTDTLEGELNKFLLTRKETIEDAFPSEVVIINIYPHGTDKPIAYSLPISATMDFIDHLYSSDRFEDIVIFSQQVIKSAKGKVYPYYKMSVSLEALGKIDEAIKEYEKLSELFPDFPVTYFRLWGIYKYDKADETTAKNQWNIFISRLDKVDMKTRKEIQSFIVTDSSVIGSYHLNISRQMDKAIKEFSMILELKPEQVEVMYNLATCYTNKGSTEKNKDIFSKGVKLLRDIIKLRPQSSAAALAEQQLKERKEEEPEMFPE